MSVASSGFIKAAKAAADNNKIIILGFFMFAVLTSSHPPALQSLKSYIAPKTAGKSNRAQLHKIDDNPRAGASSTTIHHERRARNFPNR
jgi:hypothetical protein